MPAHLACILEGQGDVASVPGIIRRIAAEHRIFDARLTTFRVHRYAIVRAGELERAIERAARSLDGEPTGILVLLDADDDLPCQIGPALRERARAARPDCRSRVIVANREKEAWYLASMRSLAGQRSIPRDVEAPEDPEGIRGAKGWLSRVMGRPYSEVADQAALGALFDLALARQRSPSFYRFSRAVSELLQ